MDPSNLRFGSKDVWVMVVQWRRVASSFGGQRRNNHVNRPAGPVYCLSSPFFTRIKNTHKLVDPVVLTPGNVFGWKRFTHFKGEIQ